MVGEPAVSSQPSPRRLSNQLSPQGFALQLERSTQPSPQGFALQLERSTQPSPQGFALQLELPRLRDRPSPRLAPASGRRSTRTAGSVSARTIHSALASALSSPAAPRQRLSSNDPLSSRLGALLACGSSAASQLERSTQLSPRRSPRLDRKSVV